MTTKTHSTTVSANCKVVEISGIRRITGLSSPYKPLFHPHPNGTLQITPLRGREEIFVVILAMGIV